MRIRNGFEEFQSLLLRGENDTKQSDEFQARLSLDFLKVLRFSFPVPVVGPSAKLSFSHSFLPQKT